MKPSVTSRSRDGQAVSLDDHGVIGDLRSAALVGRDGTISFFCAGAFDRPTIFASLLDPAAGWFSIGPEQDVHRTIQMYVPDTNVLLTRFLSKEGIAEVTDFMPVPDYGGPQRIIRHVRVIRGELDIQMRCAPRPAYAAGRYGVEVRGQSATFGSDDADTPELRLRATFPLIEADRDVRGTVRLEAGHEAAMALEISPEQPHGPLDPVEARAAFDATVAWWHRWSARSTYQGRWREIVGRSALVLKLMTSVEHGTMVAAVTFGLPEQLGGARNWDYRYCWVRDTSFAVYAFVRLGFVEEASGFLDSIGARAANAGNGGGVDPNGPLRIMYALDGRDKLPERSLDHFAGYRDSRPVRVGNAAADQFQLDIYGELMDALYLADKYGRQTSWEGWAHVCAMVGWLRDNWQRPDRGIWEGRGDDKQFLHSRLMSWVAIDRAIRLANARWLPAPLPERNQTRLQIHYSIHQEFWDAELGSFVQYPGAKTVDGSMLLMPLLRFIAGDDPCWLTTLVQIEKQLVTDVLVRRRRSRTWFWTDWRATRARSWPARSGISRRWRGPGRCTGRGCCSTSCSAIRTTSVCMPRSCRRPATSSATRRRC